MKKYIITAFLLSQFIEAQETKIKQILPKFDHAQIEWQLPFAENKTIKNIQWQERPSSLSPKGIKTYVAYHQKDFIGVISIYNNVISGEISYQGKHYNTNYKSSR